jgi:hypothetical protein
VTNSERVRKYALKRIEQGLCIRCGKEPAIPGIQIGLKCKPIEKDRNRRYIENRLAAGICRVCCKNKISPPRKTRCDECSLRHRLAAMGLSPEEQQRTTEYFLHFFRGRCESCGTTDPGKKDWCVDHDHKTGRFRGILCNRCNVALGMVRDNPTVLLALVQYLSQKA